MPNGNAVVERKTLEERLAAKMAESIDGLITAEDMKGYVAKGINKALFEQREVRDSWGHKRGEKSLVDELVDKHLRTAMETAIHKWLAENPEKIEAAVNAAIAAGAGASLMRALDQRFGNVFNSALDVMRQQGLLPTGM